MLHPNLFYSEEELNRYTERMKTDESLMSRYAEISSSWEKVLEDDFITEYEANSRQSLHSNFGDMRNRAHRACDVLGSRYMVEKDERCAEKLKQLLFHYISFERWYAQSYAVRKPIPWHSDLCSTGITFACGRIYDIIYNYLSESERKEIARGIFEKGIKPAFSDWVIHNTRIHALDSMGHNWWAVCIGETATALLAVRDELPEEADEYLRLASEACAEYLGYKGNRLFNKLRNFDEQGMFYESVGYSDYGTGTVLRFLWCYERYFGRNEIIRQSIPAGLGEAIMYFSYPCTIDGKLVFSFLNFGDSTVDTQISTMGKYAVRTGIASDALKKCVSTYKTDFWDDLCEGYYTELEKGVINLPEYSVLSSGYAICRSSWEPDSTVFAVKSGFCWNHSHNDSGSFVIFHKGRELFIDSGTCSYEDKLYHPYYCQDVAHSVLLIGNQGRRDEELYRGTKFPGTINDYIKGEDYFFVQADSTGPMAHLCSRMFRNFFWIRNKVLVIVDEVYCHEENDVQFTLHFNDRYSNEGNSIDIRYEDLSAKCIRHYPETSSIQLKDGHPDHRQNEILPYIEINDCKKERTHILITTIEIDSDKESAEYSLLSDKNSPGISVKFQDETYTIWFNELADGHVMHDNSNSVIGGYNTDAYLFMEMKKNDSNASRVLMINGSYFRKEEKTAFGSFIKETKEFEILL